jgi:hypothetical protein
MGKILFPKYFPICPTDGSEYVVPGYTAVITATLAETMKSFWRPRKIKVSGSYTQFSEGTRECSISANFELIIQSPYGSEEEMICEPILPWVVASSNNIANIDNCFYWDGKPYYYGDPINSFYTFNTFDFQLELGPFSTPCNLGLIIKQLYLVESNGGPYDWVPIDIAGVQYQMATYVNELGFGYVGASVEVLEWWSFGGTYNTETGNPL